jgi:hypothetical protein
MFFENIHFDTINAIDKLTPTVFATGSDDGSINVIIINQLRNLDLGY